MARKNTAVPEIDPNGNGESAAMKTFHCVIRGTKPILLNNPAGRLGKSGAKKQGESSFPTAEEAAKASCYWMPDRSSLMFPADNIHAALIAGAGTYKIGRKSIVPFVAGSVEIAPEHIPFNTKQYKIDTRRAVVQRQGILRSRAKLLTWELGFDLLVDEDWLSRNPGEDLKQMLQEAGRRVGIGDFRPQKRGKFGKFIVITFEERK